MSKYANRYWKTGEKNVYGKECYLLHFTEFYEEEDEVILGFVQDNEEDNTFIYNSKLLNVEYDSISANSIEEAKEILESMVVDHINEQISDLEEKLRKFNELK